MMRQTNGDNNDANIKKTAFGQQLPVHPNSGHHIYLSHDNSRRAKDGKINLNTATSEELQTISGIGAKRAEDIIAYRESHGGFQSIDDLKNVSGIGEKTLDKIRESLYVA